MARQLKSTFKNFWANQLLSEEKEDALVAAFYRHPQLSALRWRRINGVLNLPTPYGLLTIANHVGKCRLVERHGAELIHSSTGKPVVFRSLAAAKVAAIYHASDGFQGSPVVADGCGWNIGHSICSAIPAGAGDPCTGEMLPDEYEIEPEDLNDRLEKFFGHRSAADLLLLGNIRAEVRTWALRPPNWSNAMIGQYFLTTPSGLLTARRFLWGWLINRNEELLTWFLDDQPVVFGRLQDAKLAALVHGHDHGWDRFADLTNWASKGPGQIV